MKVLWFSNCVLTNDNVKGSGSWLYAMSSLISHKVQLFNITESRNVSKIIRSEYNGITEFILPIYPLNNGLPSKKNIYKIKGIVEEIKPDIIHVWGIEKYWGLLFVRHYLNYHPLIEIQGVLSSCYDVFWGGMTPSEIIYSFSLKEILKPSCHLWLQKKAFKKKICYEKEIISHLKIISTQSQWTRNQLHSINPGALVFNTKLPIRAEFWNAKKWSSPQHENFIVVFSSLGYYHPFKGIHILIKAINELKTRGINVFLKIAGPNISELSFYLKSGYQRYILSLIKKMDLCNNVEFLGNLDASGIIYQLQNADVFVNPSFVESFSASTAEALCIGIPTVLSYAGAMPEFSQDLKTALYYSPTDYRTCASLIESLSINQDIRNEIIANSTKVIEKLCSSNMVVQTQLEIYKNFMSMTL